MTSPAAYNTPDKAGETFGEELANSLTHGVGAILSLATLAFLVPVASVYGNAWVVAGCAVFGTCLVLLYGASTLFHSFPQPGARRVFSVFDHCAIFLLIAGTYTPFLLVNLRGPIGWLLFGVVWALAVLGIVLRVSLRKRPTSIFVGLYVGMGWVALIAIKPIVMQIPIGGLALLIAGGLAYTAGVGFYLWRTLPYNHAIWHVAVIAGSMCHVAAVYYYVIPAAAGI